MGPSARMVEVLKEGGGLYFIAHSPQHGTFRYGLRDYMAEHPGIDEVLRKEIAATGMIPLWLAREWEVAKYVRDPGWGKGRTDREAMALRWVDAKHHGGYEWREAVQLIWDYSKCAGAIPQEATAPEIVHESELPWRYRQAWKRSHNGGPVSVDQAKAQAIDEARMWAAYQERAA